MSDRVISSSIPFRASGTVHSPGRSSSANATESTIRSASLVLPTNRASLREWLRKTRTGCSNTSSGVVPPTEMTP